MNRKVMILASIVVITLITSGFFLYGKNPQTFLTDENLPTWTTQGVNKTADELFKAFKITAKRHTPQVNDIFPTLNLHDINGNSISLRGKPSVLIIGSSSCSSCETIVEVARKSQSLQIIKLIPYGSLPTITEQEIYLVDARLDTDKNNREIIPSSGKLESWIGMAQFIGSYVLDKSGLVYYAAFQASSISELTDAIHRIELGQTPAEPSIRQPTLGKKLQLPQNLNQKTALEPLLKSKTGVVIFTAEGCSACDGLTNDIKAAAKKWINQGVSVAIIDSGRQENGELMPGVPIVADANNELSNAWGRVGLPQAIILDRGQYAGTTPFAESQFQRQLPGQPVESFRTKAPFTRAIGSSISYIQEKRGDNNP